MLGVASAISTCVEALVLVAFLVAIATAVRRYRPDAVPILLGATIFELSISVVAYLARVVLPRFFLGGGSGTDSVMEAYAISGVVFSVAHAAARLLLLWGIVRLAQPAGR